MIPRLLPFLASFALCHADSLTLKDGESLQGELVDTQANFVLLRLPETEGEATRRIAPLQIETLAFSDTDAPLEQQALKRAKFQSLLSEADARILLDYLDELQSAGHPLTALAYAKLWHPKNNYPQLDPTYREQLINSSLAAGLPEEALVHAQNWIKRSPAPTDHALPWIVQAEHQLKTENLEAALWTSLTPLAYASRELSPHRQKLQQIASHAYQRLGYDEHAQAYASPDPAPKSPLVLDPQSSP